MLKLIVRMIMVNRKGVQVTESLEGSQTCVVQLLHLTEEEAEFQKSAVPTLKV